MDDDEGNEECVTDPRCNLCGYRLVPPVRMFEHPRLSSVPICALCFENEPGELDSDDEDVCVWCANNDCGEVLLCDDCDNGFCTSCISEFLGVSCLEKIKSTDPWSCFICDSKQLDSIAVNFQVEYFPSSVDATGRLLLDVENEIALWEMKSSDEADETLQSIRAEMVVASNGGEVDDHVVGLEFSNVQDMWRHHLELLDHRLRELQDHYTDLGGDLKVFYTVFQSDGNGSSDTHADMLITKAGGTEVVPEEKAILPDDFVNQSMLKNDAPPVLSFSINIKKRMEAHHTIPSVYDDALYYVRTSSKNGKAAIMTDLGETLSDDHLSCLNSMARLDNDIMNIISREEKFGVLFSPERRDSSSILPPVFYFHVPSTILIYLFYEIGRLYPINIKGSATFEIDSYLAGSDHSHDAIDDIHRKNKLKEVISKYRIPKEVLVVLKYVNCSCRYMSSSPIITKAPSSAPVRLEIEKILDNEEADCSFSYGSLESEWRSWPMAQYVHPAFMEAIYCGRSHEWGCLVGKFGVPADMEEDQNEDIEICSAEESLLTYVSYCQQHSRPVNREIYNEQLVAAREFLAEHKTNHYSSNDKKSVQRNLDSLDCEEDKSYFRKKRSKRCNVFRDSSLSSCPRPDKKPHASKKLKDFPSNEIKNGCSVSSKQGSDCIENNGKEVQSQSMNEASLTRNEQSRLDTKKSHAVDVAKSYLDRLNNNITISQSSKSGSQSFPVCLSDESDDEQIESIESDNEVVEVLPQFTGQDLATPSKKRCAPLQSAAKSPSFKRIKRVSSKKVEDLLSPCAQSSGMNQADDIEVMEDTPTAPPVVLNAEELIELFGTDDVNGCRIEMHSSFSSVLKPHQIEAVKFIWKNVMRSTLDYTKLQPQKEAPAESSNLNKPKIKAKADAHGCILAHFMGLGKTLTVISFLATVMKHPLLADFSGYESVLHDRVLSNIEKEAATTRPFIFRALVLAPVTVVFNWVSEFETWLPKEYVKNILNKLFYCAVSGGGSNCRSRNGGKDESRRNLIHWRSKGGVCVMGYEQFISLQNQEQFKDLFVSPGPDIVILDEAHRIKDDSSCLYKALQKLKSRRRIALTGSPLQNNLLEYFHMVNFVKHNHLQRKKTFMRHFVDPIKAGEGVDASPAARSYMKRRLHVLSKRLSKIVNRKDITHLKSMLPPKREFILSVKLTPFQEYLYKLFLKKIFAEPQSPSGINRGDDVEKKRGGVLFRHAKVGLLIWNHPMCLPLNDIIRGPTETKSGSSLVSLPSIALLASKLDGVYQDFFENKPITAPALSCAQEQELKLDDKTEKKQVAESEDNRIVIDVLDDSDDDDVEGEICKLNKSCAGWWSCSSNGTSSDCAMKSLSGGDIMGLGNKMVLFLSILSKAIETDDKVVLFSQSLTTLSYIELILQSNWGEMIDTLTNVGSTPPESSETSMNSHSNINWLSRINGRSSSRASWCSGKEYFRLDGDVKASDRKVMMNRFNDSPRSRLFLISTKAGNMGSNIQSANRVIIFDASWNPVHDLQAIFRCFRYGQKKAVFVYRLLASGTLEEVIYKRQLSKMALAARVVDSHMPVDHFTTEEIVRITQTYKGEENRDDDKDSERILAKVTEKDDHLLNAVFLGLISGPGRLLKDVNDMDPLLEDVEDEHLDETEKVSAEREYEAELNADNSNNASVQRNQLQLLNQTTNGIRFDGRADDGKNVSSMFNSVENVRDETKPDIDAHNTMEASEKGCEQLLQPELIYAPLPPSISDSDSDNDQN